MDTNTCANHTHTATHFHSFFSCNKCAMLLQSGSHVNREATFNLSPCQHFTTSVQNVQGENSEWCAVCGIPHSSVLGLEFFMVLFVFNCVDYTEMWYLQTTKNYFNLSRTWKSEKVKWGKGENFCWSCQMNGIKYIQLHLILSAKSHVSKPLNK